MDGFEATCGLRFGGQGDWATAKPPGCRLVITDLGLIASMDILTAKWDGQWKAGLFQNDYHPTFRSRLSDLQPCDFSGYAGLQIAFHWLDAEFTGLKARTTANDVAWMHNGGPKANFVYGYYFVSPTGELHWAERFCPDPVKVDKLGLVVRIRPTFYLSNDPPD